MSLLGIARSDESAAQNEEVWFLQIPLFPHTLGQWMTQNAYTSTAPAYAVALGADQNAKLTKCATMLREILLGLHFLHQCGVVHRE
jgi:hypothetical protein